MRLLLDECVPRRLRHLWPGHEAATVEEAGVKGLKNGQLLRAMTGRFDVLLTVDKSIPNQQNLADCQIALIILHARSNRYEDLATLVPQALAALANIQPGEFVRIEIV